MYKGKTKNFILRIMIMYWDYRVIIYIHSKFQYIKKGRISFIFILKKIKVEQK